MAKKSKDQKRKARAKAAAKKRSQQKAQAARAAARLRRVRMNDALAMKEASEMRRGFDAKYGDACRERGGDWYTITSGHAAGQKVFVITAETAEWANGFFGSFDEADMRVAEHVDE